MPCVHACMHVCVCFSGSEHAPNCKGRKEWMIKGAEWAGGADIGGVTCVSWLLLTAGIPVSVSLIPEQGREQSHQASL